MDKLKISVIGCGYWGKTWCVILQSSGYCILCDANQELANQAAKAYDVASLSLEELLKSACDGVVIAAPAAQHFELTQRALNAGKHVFVEKPLSLKVEEAKKLCDRSMQVGKSLWLATCFNTIQPF